MKQVLFFFAYLRFHILYKTEKEGAAWTYDTPSVVDKIIFPAAYTQLETPSEVAIAVRMLIAI